MFNFWKKKVAVTAKVKRTPVKGEVWVLMGDGPWPRKDTAPAQIQDVQDGWVRYYLNGLFNDERMRVCVFIDMYAHADGVKKQ